MSFFFLTEDNDSIGIRNDKEICGKDAAQGLPVDVYIGGKEHATLHLYFARFITHFLHDLGISPVKEPFKKLIVQGMVKSKTYKYVHTVDPPFIRYFNRFNSNFISTQEPKLKDDSFTKVKSI